MERVSITIRYNALHSFPWSRLTLHRPNAPPPCYTKRHWSQCTAGRHQATSWSQCQSCSSGRDPHCGADPRSRDHWKMFSRLAGRIQPSLPSRCSGVGEGSIWQHPLTSTQRNPVVLFYFPFPSFSISISKLANPSAVTANMRLRSTLAILWAMCFEWKAMVSAAI